MGRRSGASGCTRRVDRTRSCRAAERPARPGALPASPSRTPPSPGLEPSSLTVRGYRGLGPSGPRVSAVARAPVPLRAGTLSPFLDGDACSISAFRRGWPLPTMGCPVIRHRDAASPFCRRDKPRIATISSILSICWYGQPPCTCRAGFAWRTDRVSKVVRNVLNKKVATEIDISERLADPQTSLARGSPA
jgi:hypothetical protein